MLQKRPFNMKMMHLHGGKTKCCLCYLLGDETSDDVSSMNINSAHGHDFLPVARAQFSQQQANQ